MGIKRKPAKKSDIDLINDFISGAESPHEESKVAIHPWDDANPEVIKTFNLRLPLPLKMKLQYIIERSPKSMHKFIIDEVERAIKRELKEMGIEE